MDISRFTQSQQESIRCTQDHLFIEAGAGTGKTATLTAKVAYLLGSENALSFTDISQLLAITFTRKAAAELAGRIRATLRSVGLNDQALLVDGAWVSTIHGMCARILKDHAFELGIDPTFSVITDVESDELRAEAVQEAIVGADGLRDTARYDALFDEYKVRGSGVHPKRFNVTGILDALVAALASLPDGADGIYRGPDSESPQQIARTLIAALGEPLDTLNAIAGDNDALQAMVAQGSHFVERLADALGADNEHACAVLDEVLGEKPLSSRVQKNGAGEAIAAYKKALGAAHDDYCMFLAQPLLESFLELAVEVNRLYAEKKARLGVLDDQDMLVKAYEVFEAHPEVARGYADLFRLIMIDEFQDTDRLQTDIAKMLSGSGPGNELVTVGDAQQSIYRFRGADVNLFRRFAAELPESAARKRLDTNFRSHAEVLAFVNRVFGASDVFGNDYLELGVNPKRVNPAFPENIPHIDIVLTTSQFGNGVNTDARIAFEAAEIAQRFRTIADDAKSDWDASDMVVLLRSMTCSDVYADALRAVGFEVVIAGGSVFWRLPEPALVGYLLRTIANPQDNEALFHVLVSSLMALSADELAALAIGPDGYKRRLWDGLHAEDTPDTARITFARALIEEALELSQTMRPSDVVERLLAETGYLTHLKARGASGSAECANLFKAVRKVRELEETDLPGTARIARAYAELAASTPKDQPGALMAQGQKAVRIMTIHASKGLEFPVVALAGFDAKAKSDGDFLLESVSGQTMASLMPARHRNELSGKFSYDVENDRPLGASDLLSRSITRSDYHRRLSAYAVQEAEAESRRLFYVGATRAREALILAMHPTYKKDGTFTLTKIQGDLAALFPGRMLPLENTAVDYGGEAMARYSCMKLELDETGAVMRADDPVYAPPQLPPAEASATLPKLGAIEPPAWTDAPFKGAPIYEFSYSALARAHAKTVPPAEGDADEGGTATELGSAFHKVAERMAVGGNLRNGTVTRPPADDVDAIVAYYSLTSEQQKRLQAALDAWTASAVAARAAGYPILRAEVPFYQRFHTGDVPVAGGAQVVGGSVVSSGTQSAGNVPVAGGTQAVGGAPEAAYYFDGSIDLLCLDASGRQAFIVDYKTGGSDDETPEQLQEKHLLQAMCYAEAVFEAGIESVELAFVRIEHIEADGQPQVVPYAFSAENRAAIQQKIGAELASFAQER